ncbi:AraC-like DNA-binding protein [Nitrospirillum amazonense]|uniref:AraC-like DNA-binding protein n=1 Tax=Nitrospirillum amazonense TaxID=28077 RepID=A0A560KB13_9PROT|nr:AraC family transcriptional regulator [Nitrospirillum amazonense]TWB77810.1 AraC-like DNA-binding protein [Nitrospirillum amazonense]
MQAHLQTPTRPVSFLSPPPAPLPHAAPWDDRRIVTLVTAAQAALDHDLERARGCLDQLAALLDGTEKAPVDEAILLPAAPTAETGANKGGLAPWQLRCVMGHIQANLARPLPVDQLAALANLSTNHFTRAFRASVGETPHTYVVKRRVRQAQILMLTTDQPLSEIAYGCGMADQAHLTRLFRQFVGETPLRWRRTWGRPTHSRDN